MNVIYFFIDTTKVLFKGNRTYWLTMVSLGAVFLFGVYHYVLQSRYGALATTGVSEEIPWGAYIQSFAFTVGVAAAAVMLVIPAYIFHHFEVRKVVLIGEALAVAACVMCILFILASVGKPLRLWHILPIIGGMNLPASMLAWDVVVINSYLGLNLIIPFYILYTEYIGKKPNARFYFPLVLVSIVFAIGIHTVTAFLFSSNIARPFWNTAILVPRFLASAFASGPALLIIVMQIIRRQTKYLVDERVIDFLAIVVTVSLQINLGLLGAELFNDFYGGTEHAASIEYLYFGLHKHDYMVGWIWTSLVINVVGVLIMMIHPLRRNRKTLNLACLMIILGIWMEKGMGLVVPGFIPSPIGDVVEYAPTFTELAICMGIVAFGSMLFIWFIKIIVAVDMKHMTRDYAKAV
jgi:molybdopterin-containing oxidoreductase family membrane subunit